MCAVELSEIEMVTQELVMSNVSVAVIVAVVLLTLYVAAALTQSRQSAATPEQHHLPWQLRMAQLRRSAYVPRPNRGEP
jgi:hypothetical protein